MLVQERGLYFLQSIIVGLHNHSGEVAGASGEVEVLLIVPPCGGRQVPHLKNCKIGIKTRAGIFLCFTSIVLLKLVAIASSVLLSAF